jgi:U6 snRNA-associated Sm-like protein LSm2
VGQTVTVELKNDLQIRGVLESVDQYLNLKLGACEVVERERHPQLLALRTIFVRGSVVRYVHVPKEAVDTELLQDAARKEALESAKAAGAGAGAGGKR